MKVIFLLFLKNSFPFHSILYDKRFVVVAWIHYKIYIYVYDVMLTLLFCVMWIMYYLYVYSDFI